MDKIKTIIKDINNIKDKHHFLGIEYIQILQL
jgi:hypothetical protein